jgi:ribosomal protein S18 acetylase RimI-like enzyme
MTVPTTVRPLGSTDRTWMLERLRERWGSETVVARGQARDASLLQGFVAESEGDRVGLATYEIRGAECELVTLDSFRQGTGVASALVTAVANAAYEQECRRLVVVTTNDNLGALGFYQKRGFTLRALRRKAVEKSRRLKPEIPSLAPNGIPIRDELELELDLRYAAAATGSTP